MEKLYFAHSKNSAGKWHILSDHLIGVEKLAKTLAGRAHWSDEAAFAGLLHDLGKYGDRFQARLQGEDSGLDHWSQGAWIALTQGRALAAALAIQGHHIGLQCASKAALRRLDPRNLVLTHPLNLDLSDSDLNRLKSRANMDGIIFTPPKQPMISPESGMMHAVSSMLDVRLLFSCLADADFLDTEAHFEGNANGKHFRATGPSLDGNHALTAIDAYISKIRKNSKAQTLPQNLVIPTLGALSHLSTYRSTVVFSTATQPAFALLDQAVKKYAITGWTPVEAVPDNAYLFEVLKRVSVSWPEPGETQSLLSLTKKLNKLKQVLCVVNLKRHALELLDALEEDKGNLHLSTNLCAEHRRRRLEEVRALLRQGKSCRLVSTQCVEAGVDLDFPVVYRAMSPLESIAQAAGRCNREGRLNEKGEVVVFDPSIEGDWRHHYPTYAYFQATEVTKTILKENGYIDIDDPNCFQIYYRRLYDLTKPATMNKGLSEALEARDFVEVSRQYRIIDQDSIQILVPYKFSLKNFSDLRSEADRYGISIDWIRRAQNQSVNIYRPPKGHPAWGILLPVKTKHGGFSDEWFVLEDPHEEHYDERYGLKLPESEKVFIA